MQTVQETVQEHAQKPNVILYIIVEIAALVGGLPTAAFGVGAISLYHDLQ